MEFSVRVEKVSDTMDLSRREAPSIFWLRWWKTCTGTESCQAVPCASRRCLRTAAVGVPVVRTENGSRRLYYIVPLCRSCSRSDQPLEVCASDLLQL